MSCFLFGIISKRAVVINRTTGNDILYHKFWEFFPDSPIDLTYSVDHLTSNSPLIMNPSFYMCVNHTVDTQELLVLTGPNGNHYAGDLLRHNPFVDMRIPSTYYRILFR